MPVEILNNNFSPREEIPPECKSVPDHKRDCLTAPLPHAEGMQVGSTIVGDGGGIDDIQITSITK